MRIVCGLDVHKDSVYLCILSSTGEIVEKVFGVLTFQLAKMRDLMLKHHVQEVGMESTSVYWIPIWRILEPHFKLKLVNPYFIKQLPGHKSDVKDAQWIAECMLKELVRGSFVPPERIQQLRQYDRRIFDLDDEINRKLSKLDAALQRCNIRLSNYVSNTDSKSYKEVVARISEGITDPKVLVEEIHGRIINRHGRKTIIAALTGVITQADSDMMRQIREEIDIAERHKQECIDKMQEICHFETANHLASWSGLKPRNDESNKVIKSKRITHGNRYLRRTIIECSWAASRTQGCFFSRFSYHQTQVRKKTKMKVQVAISRKLLICAWHILSKNVPYQDFCERGIS